MKLKFSTLVLATFGLLSFAAPTTTSAADAPKPNIIFILSDDVGLGNIGCYGGAFKTPNIDALAAGGTKFEQCFANPLCGPSRATCLTGRYLFRTGMLTNGGAKTLHREEIMLPKVLKPAGYVTAQIGKWNQLPLEPSEWGFDEYLRFQGSGKYWASQDKTYTQDGKEKELGARYLPDVMHEYLVDFITRHKDQPFYIHYAMSEMHNKMLPTPDSSSKKGTPETNYQDNNAYMDKLVGQLVTALDKLGLREKTLLVFVGDNGTAKNGAAAATVNGRAISGQKGTMLEGGSRVPMIVNWPGTTPAGKVLKDLTDFTDYLPTFADLAGAKLPEGVTIDGHSYAAQYRGQTGTPRDWVFVQLGQKWYARDQSWKLTEKGNLFDVTAAPYTETPIPADTKDDAAISARQRLQAVLTQLNPASGTPLLADNAKMKKGKGKKGEGKGKGKKKKKLQEEAATATPEATTPAVK